MNESELRAQASLNELAAINTVLTQRCVNGASEIAVLKARIAALNAQLAECAKKAEVPEKKAKAPRPAK